MESYRIIIVIGSGDTIAAAGWLFRLALSQSEVDELRSRAAFRDHRFGDVIEHGLARPGVVRWD